MLLRVGALLASWLLLSRVWIPGHFSGRSGFISIGIDILRSCSWDSFLPECPVVALYPVFFCNAFPVVAFKAPSADITAPRSFHQQPSPVHHSCHQFLMKRTAHSAIAKILWNDAAFFHTGAALSLILYMTWSVSGVWLCLVPAFYAVWLISAGPVPQPIHHCKHSPDGSTSESSYKKKRPDFLSF